MNLEFEIPSSTTVTVPSCLDTHQSPSLSLPCGPSVRLRCSPLSPPPTPSIMSMLMAHKHMAICSFNQNVWRTESKADMC